MTRRLNRRLRVIAARATLCALLVAALGATGFRSTAEVEAEQAAQSAAFAR